MWKRILFTLVVMIALPLIVVNTFTYKKQPTEVLNPGTTNLPDQTCFSVWCGDDWKKTEIKPSKNQPKSTG